MEINPHTAMNLSARQSNHQIWYIMKKISIPTMIMISLVFFLGCHPKNLFIYTWEGQPVMKLRLDHLTGSYALDKENDRIITLAKDIGKYVYYKIDFDELDKIN